MDYFSLLPIELIERILCSSIAGFEKDEEEDDADQGDVRADVLMLESVQESCKPFSDYVVPNSVLDEHLTPRDLFSFALTCKRHCHLVHSSGLVWKGAFSRQYPVLAQDFADRQLEMDWMKLMKDRRRLESAAKTKVEAMSDLFYHKPDLSDGDYADLATLEEAFSHDWLLDALRHILNKEDNLTTAYYGNKALKQLQFAGVIRRMEELLRSEKPDTQIYEEGMIMLAECFQPEKYISKSVVREFVNEVEQEVRKQLALQLPQHPSLKPDMPIRTKKEQLQALDCLNGVLYGDMGVRGNSQNYYDLRNVFVDEVVGRRTGMPISLCVVYLLCADRVGIECSGVNYPSHFVLACKSPSSQEGDDELYFIDAFESGKRLAPAQLTDGDYEIVRCGPRDVRDPILLLFFYITLRQFPARIGVLSHLEKPAEHHP